MVIDTLMENLFFNDGKIGANFDEINLNDNLKSERFHLSILIEEARKIDYTCRIG